MAEENTEAELPTDDALPEADEGDGLPTVEADADDAPEPEDKPKKADKADKGKDKPKMVDHRALVEARNLLKREREDRQRERERMEQRWQQIIERTAPKQPEPPPPPQFEQDPAAWLRHQTENTGKTVTELAEWRRQQETQRQQAEQDQQLQYAVGAAEQEFAAEQPDYGEALEFARTSRMNFFRAAGYSQAEAAQIVMQETKILAQRALQSGENPARRIYEIAKTFGYAQKQQAETKIEQLRKGQRASSPMSGGGAEDENLPSLSTLAEMDNDEFDKLWGRMKKAGKLG